MVQLPFTPHIEGVLQKSKDLSVILERNGVDIDILFHCYYEKATPHIIIKYMILVFYMKKNL